MNARWFISLATLGAVVAAGCGEGPSARFVVSERTKKLTPTARTAVEGELQKSFGDPNHLVAWPKLPIDFGEFEGVVEARSCRHMLRTRFKVKLSPKPKSVVEFKPEHLAGAACRLDERRYGQPAVDLVARRSRTAKSSRSISRWPASIPKRRS